MINQKIIKTDVPNCGDSFIIIENGRTACLSKVHFIGDKLIISYK